MNKYEWAIEDIYCTKEQFEEELLQVENQIDFSAYKGKLDKKDCFLACQKKLESLSRKLEKLSVYAMMNHDVDTASSEFDAMISKTTSLCVKFSEKCAFIVPELLSLDESVLLSYINDKDLNEYDYYLKGLLKDKAHVLSESEESILANLGDVFSSFKDIFTKLDNADLPLGEIEHNGEKIELTHGTYGVILHGEDRALRKKAFKSYYQAYKSLINTISATYAGNVKKNVFSAKTRKYNSVLDKALSSEDVDKKVYEKLLKSVNNALPLLHQFIKAKKQVLDYNEMHMYDIYAPITKGGELKLDYEDAYDLVIKGLEPLGKEYKDLLLLAKDNRWLSVYETKNKRSGAYSVCVYDTHPYVLLNYQKTTHDVFTIAHELGHSMHSYFSNKNQPYAKADYKIFVAEVASTVNEVLLVKYLLKTAKDESVKKYLLVYLMDMIRTTIFRQTQFSEFEEFAHSQVEKGIPLTKDSMNEYYLSLNEKYYGKDIIHEEEKKFEWSRIPHFYRAFYVYKYASGLISALAIADRILTEGESAVKDYFAFLSSGGSDSPVELLKIAGVNLMEDQPYERAFKVFEDALREFNDL